MVRILTREECGLVPPITSRLATRAPDVLAGVTVHCTVTPATDPVTTWRNIQRDYLSGNNVNHDRYGDVPYNDAITMDGRVLQGRAHHWVGAHAKSSGNLANRTHLGVALIGTGATISHAAQDALRAWLYLATVEIGHRPVLFDHYDWRAYGGIATACPDAATAAFVALLRAEWAHHG